MNALPQLSVQTQLETASIVGHVGCRCHFIDNATANPAATAWVYRVLDKLTALF